MRGMSMSETVRPVEPRMSLDVGRVNPRETAQLLSLTVGCLLVAPLAALVVWVAWPEFGAWSALRVVFVLLGVLVGALGLVAGVVVYWLMLVDWFEYRRRLADWHQVGIDGYVAAGGQETHTELTQWELSPSMPLHVLAAALSVHRRASEGTPSPWSVRRLEGPVMLSGVRLLDVSPSAAVDLANNFAALGLVSGRGERKAGDWVPQSEGEVVELVARNWKKVRG